MRYRRGDKLILITKSYKLLCTITTWFVELIGWPVMRLLYGYKAFGRTRLYRAPEGPRIYVSNHAIPLDPLLHSLSFLPELSYFTLLEETVLTPVLGTLVRLLGGIPIPADPKRIKDIEEAMGQALKSRGRIHFYPEGECFLLNQEIQDFKAGAFYYAIRSQACVVPMVTVLRRRPFLGRRRIKAEVHILDAQTPPAASGRAIADLHAAIAFASRVRCLMQDAIDSAGGDKSLYRGPMPRIKGVNDKNR